MHWDYPHGLPLLSWNWPIVFRLVLRRFKSTQQTGTLFKMIITDRLLDGYNLVRLSLHRLWRPPKSRSRMPAAHSEINRSLKPPREDDHPYLLNRLLGTTEWLDECFQATWDFTNRAAPIPGTAEESIRYTNNSKRWRNNDNLHTLTDGVQLKLVRNREPRNQCRKGQLFTNLRSFSSHEINTLDSQRTKECSHRTEIRQRKLVSPPKRKGCSWSCGETETIREGCGQTRIYHSQRVLENSFPPIVETSLARFSIMYIQVESLPSGDKVVHYHQNRAKASAARMKRISNIYIHHGQILAYIGNQILQVQRQRCSKFSSLVKSICR